MKAGLSGKVTALSAFIEKIERSHTHNYIVYLKPIKQNDSNTPKRTRKQKIFKTGTQTTKLETKRTIQRIK